MPKVNYERPEFLELKPRWDLIEDCISGERAIKAKKTDYLPMPNAADMSAANVERYKQYLIRAVFYGVTARTLRGLIGQVFAREPATTLPPVLEPLKVDADGAGVSLDQQSRKALGFALAFGRCGILTDYPKTSAAVTVAQQESGEIRPTITLFAPVNIINWRTVTIGAKKLLSLIVLCENETVSDDGFEQESEEYFRVLRLTDAQQYIQEIWYYSKEDNDFILEEVITPLDASGMPWREIPFTFIGCENNDPNPDLPPLYDLASLNIAHYRNSADYEESCFIMGQPTPFFAGLTENWVANVWKGEPIQLGARGAVSLPEGGTAGMLQAGENTMPKEAMEQKEAQMVALGAKLVEQKKIQRTATEAGQDEASTTSLLATVANNVSQAYSKALVWAGMFVGVKNAETEEGKTIAYELNNEFDVALLDPATVAQTIAAWQANAIDMDEMRDKLIKGGWAYKDLETFKASIDSAGLDLGIPVGSPASAAAAGLEAKAKADAAKGKEKPPGK